MCCCETHVVVCCCEPTVTEPHKTKYSCAVLHPLRHQIVAGGQLFSERCEIHALGLAINKPK